MRLGNSSVHTLDTSTPQISVLAGVIAPPVQPDPQPGRRLLSPPALRPPVARPPTTSPARCVSRSSTRTRWSAGMVSGGSAYPATLLLVSSSISDPNVLLWSLKPSEEGIGEGVIARTWNLTVMPNRSRSRSERADRCGPRSVTHIETDRSGRRLSPAGSCHRDRRAEPAPVVPAVSVFASPRGEDPPVRCANHRSRRCRLVHVVRTGDTPTAAPRPVHGQRCPRRPGIRLRSPLGDSDDPSRCGRLRDDRADGPSPDTAAEKQGDRSP